jgi:hypothetical protein
VLGLGILAEVRIGLETSVEVSVGVGVLEVKMVELVLVLW